MLETSANHFHTIFRWTIPWEPSMITGNEGRLTAACNLRNAYEDCEKNRKNNFS